MNRQKFIKSLQALSGWRESAFILALSERAIPNVLLYFEHQPDLYLSAPDSDEQVSILDLMDSSWKALTSKTKSEDKIVGLLDILLSPVEALNADENYGASPSLDAFWLWEQALASELNSEFKRAAEASQRSLQTITQFLEFSEGDNLSEDALVKLFDKHDLVEREFSFQSELADTLRSAERLSDDLVRKLRELAVDEGVSNIGISLEP